MLLTGGVGDSVSLYFEGTAAQYGPPLNEINRACLRHILNSSGYGGSTPPRDASALTVEEAVAEVARREAGDDSHMPVPVLPR